MRVCAPLFFITPYTTTIIRAIPTFHPFGLLFFVLARSLVVRRPSSVVPSSVPSAASSSYICCNCLTYALRSLLFFFHSRLVVRASYFPIRQNSGMKVTTESVSCKRYKMNSAFIPISHLVSLPLVSHIPVLLSTFESENPKSQNTEKLLPTQIESLFKI